MKKRNIILLSALFVFAVSLAFNADSKNVALFWIVKNNVEKSPEGGKDWKAAKKGQLIYSNDVVRTEKNAFALIKFNDTSTLRMGPSSEVQVYGENTPSSTQISSGEVGFNMAKQKDKPFQFTTPTAVASIRGTEGLFAIQINGTDFLTIIEGLVRFSNRVSNDTVDVGAGETGESSGDGKISVHKSTQDDLNRLTQLNSLFGQKHELKIQYKGSDGQMHEIIIDTQQE
jgi:hypothetical protein